MKKVFAFLSVVALTIAVVGFAPRSDAKLSADDKWTVDPTLSENDIPMYIMNSIYTTFPNFYDNAAKADDQWQGAARLYPWNESRLQVKQIDANGEFTGKEYAIFFSGGTTASAGGAGNNLMFIAKNDSGVPSLMRSDGGKLNASTGAMDPSLSHLTTNITGEDVTFDATTFGWDSSQAGNYYNRMMVFDGQGRMVRGLAGDIAHMNPALPGTIVDADENPVVVPAEFCYVDGKVAKMGDGVVCDKKQVEKVDEDGNPVLGEDGNPVMVDSDEDNILYTRFMWQWFAEKPAVNEVAYLEAGWDAQKWDYAWEDAGGWLAIAFVSAEGSAVKLRPEQLAVYNETLKARGEAEVDATAYRQMCRNITVPAGGFMYDFGYLDKGINDLYVKYIDMFMAGYKYGRKVDAEGKGMAYTATFNFSARPLYTVDAAYDGAAYKTLEGQNVIEVKPGSVINPSKNVVYTGLARYWSVQNDLTSFKADTSVLKLEIKVDGETMVYADRYPSFEAMRTDFLTDFNNWKAAKEGYKLEDGKWMKEGAEWVAIDPTKEETFSTGGDFYKRANSEIATNNATYNSFFANKEMRTKWTWLIEFLNNRFAEAGQTDSVNVANGVLAGSPGNFTASMWCFLNRWEAKPSWPSSKVDWKSINPDSFLKCPTKFGDFTIDTTGYKEDRNVVVVFTAENTETGNKSQLTLVYVMTNEYTPVLKVNQAALIIPTRLEAGRVIIGEVNKFAFCQAFNGNSVGSVVADDISYKIKFESETLDFDKPTEGEHLVVASVKNVTKEVYVKFVVVIEDITAPIVSTRDLILPFGADFNPEDGITYAVDAVDGNLRTGGVKRNWCVDMSDVPVDTTKPGDYQVAVIVSDKNGNETEATFNVTVVDTRTNLDGVTNEIKGVKAQVGQLGLSLDEVAEKADALKGQLEALQGDVTALKDVVAKLESFVTTNVKTKCGAKSAVIVEFLAATSLLVVFLRKKH